MGSRTLVALAGCALAISALAFGSLPAAHAVPENLQDEVGAAQAVLDARVAALKGGDRDAWMATVDPQATAAFKDAQGRQFDGLRSLPLATFGLRVRTADSGDLSHGLAARYGGATVFLPETRQTLRFRDYDDRDEIDSLWLTFVQRSGRWFVGGDDDLAPLGIDTARGPWEFGPVRTLATAHFLTIYHPAQAARAAALAGIAEEAMGALTTRWDKPWPGKIPMILPGSIDELEKLLQSTVDLTKFVAFVSYGTIRDSGWEATAPRVYIQDHNLAAYGHDFQLQTLTHELSHAAAAPIAGPFIPSWVHEGLADWVATGRRTGERPSGGTPPRDYQFTTGSQLDIIGAYRQSRALISSISARSGLTAPTAFFADLGAVKIAPGSVDFNVDQSLRRTVGYGLPLPF